MNSDEVSQKLQGVGFSSDKAGKLVSTLTAQEDGTYDPGEVEQLLQR